MHNKNEQKKKKPDSFVHIVPTSIPATAASPHQQYYGCTLYTCIYTYAPRQLVHTWKPLFFFSRPYIVEFFDIFPLHTYTHIKYLHVFLQWYIIYIFLIRYRFIIYAGSNFYNIAVRRDKHVWIFRFLRVGISRLLKYVFSPLKIPL